MFWSKPPLGPQDPNGDKLSVKSASLSSSSSPATSIPRAATSTVDNIVEGYAAESTESNIRYAAYATRIRTILLSAHRYVAYTSDIGESFRPVAHPNLVRSAYGISWLYILGDVGYEGYKSYLANERLRNSSDPLTPRVAGGSTPVNNATNVTAGHAALSPKEKQDKVEADGSKVSVVPPLEDYRTVMVQRAIFQSLASMGLPAFTIHSVVKYSGRALKNAKSARLRTWGPIGLGLLVVPFLPSLFDEPVENAVEWTFHTAFKAYGGDQYVGHAPTTGREDMLAKRPKEKDL